MGGLSEPVFERHGTFMDVEPETGIVVNFSRRYQVCFGILTVQPAKKASYSNRR